MKGKLLPFPPGRRFVLDILRAAKSVPSFPVDRWMDLAEVAEVREACRPRISWAALFVKAWGLVSAEVPQLRQSFVSYPWPYLYQHPISIASISVHRRIPGDSSDRLIWCRIRQPENFSLHGIQNEINHSQQAPLESLFLDGQRLARAPWPFRHIAWHILMRWWGRERAKKLGTFTLSTLAGQNATNRQHPLIVTTSLSYAPLDSLGRCLVTLQCDHRVLDGVLAAECLDRMEEIFHRSVIEELKASALHSAQNAA